MECVNVMRETSNLLLLLQARTAYHVATPQR